MTLRELAAQIWAMSDYGEIAIYRSRLDGGYVAAVPYYDDPYDSGDHILVARLDARGHTVEQILRMLAAAEKGGG